jgi:hypothetical protein
MAKQNPVRGVRGAKFCGVIVPVWAATWEHLRLQIESDNAELLSGTGPLRGAAPSLSHLRQNKHVGPIDC